MKKAKQIIIGLVVVTAVAIAGKSIMKPTVEATVEEQKSQAVAVEVATAENGNIQESLFAIGSIDPETTYDVNVQAPGKVDAVYFEIGDHVNKNDTLFQMDTDSFDINKNSQLAQASNRLETSKISYNQAKTNYENQEILYNKQLIAQTEFDNVKRALDQAQIQYNNAKTDYQTQTSSFGDQLENYIIKSPVSGIIIGKTISNNQYASTQNGYTIIESNKLKINSSITSKYVQKISPGQKVDIYVNTIEKSYQGQIESVSYVAQKGSYPIEISIESDGKILPGMYAELQIQISTKENTLIIPKSALIEKEGQQYVYQVKENQTAHKTPVSIGLKDTENIEIVQGLESGTQIITTGKEYLDEGSKIVIE